MTGAGEIPLAGGRTTAGVVRVGDTVRRPPGPQSEFVAALLRGLRQAGFDAAPAPLGRDEQGRDMFGFIQGEAPAELRPYGNAALVAAARLIRRYHDATADMLGPAAAALGLEVVCHNDLSPCNAVFRNGEPVALIDFDAARPGTRLHDLGYAAWLWLDLGGDAHSAAGQARRLRLFASAYGHADPGSLLDAARLRQDLLRVEARSAGRAALSEWAAACAAWVDQHRSALLGAG